MDDLRSLEGVGQLLSQKLNQTNGKIKSKPKHKRSTSVPTILKGDATTSISISTYFPPQLAEALANRINTGFNQVMPADKPNLLKSHSGFTKQDIPKLNTNQQQKSNQNGSTSIHNHSSVSFAEYQNVNSPDQSMSPPMSPSAFQKLTEDNQYGHHGGPSSGSSFSQRGHFTALPSSPSWRMGSFRSGNSLHLDLGDIGLLGDEGLDKFPPPLDTHDSYNTSYSTLQDMEYPSSPKSNNNNVPPLRKVYSNNELFTLYSGDETMSSSAEDILALNTRMNSSIPSNCVPILNQLSETKSHGDNMFMDMNMKLEDFMEYSSEQKDAFNNIGNGASGIVRKAFHFRSCKMVAIKQCRSKQKHEIDAFIKEAKYYEQFADNDNIVNILGFGKDDNGSFAMAMEYMDLGSCDSLQIDELKEDYMNKELIVGYIIFNTLSALVALHDQLYVHNDIKPANILCNRYGEIKLSDFGTVLKLRSNFKKHLLKKNNGTQRYQSPEKMIYEPIRYNTKTDVWSIGVTTYELLFGDSYAADNELAYINSRPKLNNKKKYKISAECCDFMTLCFEENYEKRASAKELIEHEWFKKYIKQDVNISLWPWYIAMPGTELQADVFAAIDGMNGRKRRKGVTFAPNVKHNEKKKKKPQLYNEDLLFMISALIIYYSAQFFDAKKNNNDTILHRRRSHVQADKQNGAKGYSDDERITNMAKYAACSKEIVKDKIRLTVNYIKSQIWLNMLLVQKKLLKTK